MAIIAAFFKRWLLLHHTIWIDFVISNNSVDWWNTLLLFPCLVSQQRLSPRAIELISSCNLFLEVRYLCHVLMTVSWWSFALVSAPEWRQGVCRGGCCCTGWCLCRHLSDVGACEVGAAAALADAGASTWVTSGRMPWGQLRPWLTLVPDLCAFRACAVGAASAQVHEEHKYAVARMEACFLSNGQRETIKLIYNSVPLRQSRPCSNSSSFRVRTFKCVNLCFYFPISHKFLWAWLI